MRAVAGVSQLRQTARRRIFLNQHCSQRGASLLLSLLHTHRGSNGVSRPCGLCVCPSRRRVIALCTLILAAHSRLCCAAASRPPPLFPLRCAGRHLLLVCVSHPPFSTSVPHTPQIVGPEQRTIGATAHGATGESARTTRLCESFSFIVGPPLRAAARSAAGDCGACERHQCVVPTDAIAFPQLHCSHRPARELFACWAAWLGIVSSRALLSVSVLVRVLTRMHRLMGSIQQAPFAVRLAKHAVSPA